MTNERRYQDHEVREILESAIGQEHAPPPSLTAGEGLTLRELHDVGREVGLAPSRISEAVAAFEARGEALPRTTTLGLPTTVSRIVPLPRRPTDLEWDRLVAELRTTFGAKGEVTSVGGLREWSYGTLHAFLEPTETGYRLRLTDSRAAALGVGFVFGGFLLSFALLILLVLLGKENPGSRLYVPLFFSLGGAGILGLTARTLPRWAREQEKHMEHLSSFATALLSSPGTSAE